MNTKQFCEKHQIRATVANGHNPHLAYDMPAGSCHYHVTLYRGRVHPNNRILCVPFSMGPALCREPTAAEALDCLASDAAGYENASGDFDAWCEEYGYDNDSRQAKRVFRAVEAQTRELQDKLGSDLFADLLWETERA